MSTMIQAEVPDMLWQQAQAFVNQGWVDNMQSLLSESLRRYLESHQASLTEQLILEDVAWGLHGDE